MAACGREAVAPLRHGGLHFRYGKKAFGKVSQENAPAILPCRRPPCRSAT